MQFKVADTSDNSEPDTINDGLLLLNLQEAMYINCIPKDMYDVLSSTSSKSVH